MTLNLTVLKNSEKRCEIPVMRISTTTNKITSIIKSVQNFDQIYVLNMHLKVENLKDGLLKTHLIYRSRQ